MSNLPDPLPFASSLDEAVFFIVYVAWFLSEMLGTGFRPARRAGVRVRKKGDRGSRILIVTGVFFSVAVGFAFGYAQVDGLPTNVFYVGIAAMVLGILVRQWAVAVLGTYFSQSVRVVDGQKVIRTGPYRCIRHPAYAGAILTLTGVGLALTSWGATLVIVIFAAFAYGYRIHVEEQFLIRELGPEYVAYMRKTKRLIPFLL